MSQAMALAALSTTAVSSTNLAAGGLTSTSTSSSAPVVTRVKCGESSVTGLGLGSTHQKLSSSTRACEEWRWRSFPRSCRSDSLSRNVVFRGARMAQRTAASESLAAMANSDLEIQAEEVEEETSSTRLDSKEDERTHLLATWKHLLAPALGSAPILFASRALAANGDYGILEGRSIALLHPLIMAVLFGTTTYAGYLGWQWRRVRTIQDEVNALKAQLPTKVEGAPPSPLEAQIQQLSETRKELVKGGFKDRHNNVGSLLLGLGVLTSVGGGLNTYLRTGRLFPGPHLYAGAGITVLWALAAALVPAMQKGNSSARYAHITLNALNLLLFVWQIPTGIEIVYKVFEFTTWP